MHSLARLLNPDRRTEPEPDQTIPSSDVSPAPDTDLPSSPSSAHLAGDRDVSVLSSGHHPPHAQCPNTLDCLPDTAGKPQHTLPVILKCAILGSPNQRLTIRDIYATMEGKYPYYKSAGTTWKQSVRHHLSLNRLFERQPRPDSDPGFGSYWTVNLLAPPGTKRPRKRGRPNKTANTTPPEPDNYASNVPRNKGRPRKEPDPRPKPYSPAVEDDDDVEDAYIPRPPTDEDYDTPDEQMDPPENALNTFPPPPKLPLTFKLPSHPQSPCSPKPSSPQYDDSDANPERLRREFANYRRQSEETIERLTSQLIHAQQDASRLRDELHRAEDQLELESLRRRDAEYNAVGETHLRQDAEDALTTLQQRWAASVRDDH